MKKFILVVAGLVLAPISFADPVCTGHEDTSEALNHLAIGPFTYKMTYNPETDEGRFNLLRQGKVVYSQKGSHFFINPASKCSGLPIAGTSITGQHRSELAVVNWTGGAHCCYTLFVIALEDKPFLIQKIELEHSSPDFRDMDEDGVPELMLSDWTFAYWKIAFAQSPAPHVALSFNGKKWAYDPNLNIRARSLYRDSPGLQSKVKQAFIDVESDAALGDQGDTGAPVILWDEMLNRIYAGNADLAFKLVNEVWPRNNPFKNKFLCEFRIQLRQSQFFDELAKINHRRAALLRKDTSCLSDR